jgi:hypothetical protein
MLFFQDGCQFLGVLYSNGKIINLDHDVFI